MNFYKVTKDKDKIVYLCNYKIHREGGSAFGYVNGSKYWYYNGKRHREGGPAVEYIDGYKEWWIDGKLRKTE